ncbi:MAG: hypothetical protein JXA71_04475, partial [Chitinispirillaceae bacterium]|nr:hypothetical protein [Chitinispirillaceae bacterium]
VATLTATVWDVNDNLVNNADVNFLLLAGPGGGEHIDNPMATTQNGKATAKLYAGSVPSMYRSVMVSASVAVTGDTSKLTISGEPYAISVSYPEEDTVTVPNAGQINETTFDFFMGAVVCDINGNPVADNTRVNFSAVVSGMAVHRKYFIRWANTDGDDPKAIYGYYVKDVPFEDINNNLRMDENDLQLDYNTGVASRGDDVNGDGTCDFNPLIHDLWVDFNDNGLVDLAVGEDDTLLAGGITMWADVYPNGVRDRSELIRDHGVIGAYDVPASGDRLWWEHECLPYWFREPFDFRNNDFGVVINTSAMTIAGVANVELTYPRQLARRLIVSINAESNGVRDRSGARFVLPVIGR